MKSEGNNKKWRLVFETDNTFTKHGKYYYYMHSSMYDFDKKDIDTDSNQQS